MTSFKSGTCAGFEPSWNAFTNAVGLLACTAARHCVTCRNEKQTQRCNDKYETLCKCESNKATGHRGGESTYHFRLSSTKAQARGLLDDIVELLQRGRQRVVRRCALGRLIWKENVKEEPWELYR
jgi:hypothetical protein